MKCAGCAGNAEANCVVAVMQRSPQTEVMSQPLSIPPAILVPVSTGSVADALHATLTHFDCQAGTVHRLEAGVLKLAASVNIPPPVMALIETVPIGKGIAGLAAERLEPITLCNLQTDTSGQARPAAKQTGMEGAIAVPILVKGVLCGVLGIAKASAYEWSAHESGLLLAIASRLGERI